MRELRALWQSTQHYQFIYQPTNLAASEEHMSQFNKGDVVQCSDTTSKHYLDGGVVTESIAGMSRVKMYLSQTNVPFRDSQLILIQAAGAPIPAMPVIAPNGVTCHIQVGDVVKYIGAETKLKGARGIVAAVYKVIAPVGPDYLAAMVDTQWGREEIPCDSLIATAPMVATHYQPVSHSDQDIDNHNADPVKKPFEHSDLGTDLSGDELMDSIRSICGR